VLQNLIAKFALQFPVLATNKASVTPSKKQWCATMGQETLLDNCGCRDFQSKQSFQSYRQLKEFIDGWVQKKDNISFNAQQLFAMPKYSTYKGPS
jgi:hypothetical protein